MIRISSGIGCRMALFRLIDCTLSRITPGCVNPARAQDFVSGSEGSLKGGGLRGEISSGLTHKWLRYLGPEW
jgi:hypothetical protein